MSEISEGVCPHCQGRGWYVVPNRATGEPEQQQCEGCQKGPQDPSTPEGPQPVPTTEPPDLKVVLSPSETRGKWKPFTEYVGADPESDIPAVRVDGWTDADGVRWVTARTNEAPQLKVVFDDAYLRPLFLVRHDGASVVATAARRVRRARRELSKRGL